MRIPALIVLLILTPTTTAQDADCDICPGGGRIECVTCKAKGVVVLPCAACSAKGRVKCPVCGPNKKRDAELKAREDQFRKTYATRHGASKASRIPRWKPAPKGRVPCRSGPCHGGRIVWTGGDTNPCKLCGAKGHVKCGFCKSGNLACLTCGGDRKRTVTCPTCHGKKSTSCPGCRAKTLSDRCPLCRGRPTRDCQLCPTGKHPFKKCGLCGATGKHNCRSCGGAKKTACGQCAAAGKIRIKLVEIETGRTGKGGVRTCKSCEGTGTRDCHECKSGKVHCQRCGGLKRLRAECIGKIVCACVHWGPHAPLEALGDVLLAAGKKEEAARFFDAALVEATKPVRDSALSEKQRKAYQSEWKRAAARIQRKLKKAGG